MQSHPFLQSTLTKSAEEKLSPQYDAAPNIFNDWDGVFRVLVFCHP